MSHTRKVFFPCNLPDSGKYIGKIAYRQTRFLDSLAGISVLTGITYTGNGGVHDMIRRRPCPHGCGSTFRRRRRRCAACGNPDLGQQLLLNKNAGADSAFCEYSTISQVDGCSGPNRNAVRYRISRNGVVESWDYRSPRESGDPIGYYRGRIDESNGGPCSNHRRHALDRGSDRHGRSTAPSWTHRIHFDSDSLGWQEKRRVW